MAQLIGSDANQVPTNGMLGTAAFVDVEQLGVSEKVSKTGDTINGDLNFSGTGRRITGDFSNATLANRLLFQTSTPNAQTSVGILSNGLSTTANINVFGGSDPANVSFTQFAVTGSKVILKSGANGSGALLPLIFHVGNAERLRIDPTTGNVLATSGLGYGVGSGGTVTQATSKATAVTLNKPSGQITMNGESLAAGATVAFVVNNSLITELDSVIVSGLQIHNWSNYILRVSVSSEGFVVQLKNDSASALAEPLVFNFAVIKGATS